MKELKPPKWADKFLEWYCRPELLEDIQGDVHELFFRQANENKETARIKFVWNVLRFFRWKNIRKSKSTPYINQLSPAMFKNILIVSARNFFRQPGHSFLNVIGLSAGFTCAFLILLWVAHEFSFDRFHNETDRLFKVLTHVEANGSVQTYDAAAANIDVASVPEAAGLVSVSTGERWPHELCFRVEGKPNECIYFHGVYANESFFSVLNFPILHGDENPLRQPANISISEKMAAALYGNESPVGKVIKIDDTREVTIASVFKDVPENSTLQFDFVMPFDVLKKQWGINDEVFNNNFFTTYLKVNTSISSEALTEKLNTTEVITEEYKAQHVRYQAYPLTDWRLKSKFEDGKNTGGRIQYVTLFIVVALLVVIMAVINFVNMTTARATTRAKEIGIRKVTGAFRSSIIAQFIGESFLIVFVAFALALFCTQGLLPYFSTLLNEPISLKLYSGWLPVYFVAFLLLIAVLAGIYPAFVMSSFQPVKILKNQITSQLSGSQRLRKYLLVVQLSVSTGIIIFTGVLYYQLNFITEKNLGFDRDNVLRIEPTMRLFQKFDAFKNELSKSAAIVSAGTSAANPLSLNTKNTGVSWPGKPNDLRISFQTFASSYEFPETIGLKILEGRNFESKSLDSLNTEVLVTEDAVKTMGLAHPIGEHISIGDSKCVIIGVVNDFYSESLHESKLPVIIYRAPYHHTSAIYVKYQPGKTQQALAAVSQAYKNIEPSFTMKYWFQDETFDNLYKTEITASRVILLFTGISLVIAIIGIVGLSTFNLVRRTKEIGIRRVMGASMMQIMTILSREFVFMMLFAILITAPLAWFASDRWLAGFAYHVSMPWWLYAITFVGITALTIGIICWQGFKTAAMNPTQTLRNE